MPLSHAAHKVYKIRYHIVIVAKCRKWILLPSDRIAYLRYLLSEITKCYDIKFEAIGTDGNHFHIFVDAPPKYSPLQIIRVVKSIIARTMFAKFPEIKKDSWGGEPWSDGGYVGTIGDETTANVVRNYISGQGTKDEKKDYKQFKLSAF